MLDHRALHSSEMKQRRHSTRWPSRRIGMFLIQVFCWGCLTGLAATIRGTVEGPRGLLAGAEVTLLREERIVQVVSSDPQGGFLFEGLSPDAYQLQIVFSPYLPVVRQVAISEAPEVVELTILLGSLNEAVTVTASRLPSPVATSISEVKVLAAEQLDQMPYQTLDDQLRSFPEFSLFRRSSSLVAHPTTQGVSLRGIGPSGVSRSLVLTDGVPLNDAFGGRGYWDRVPLLSLQQVEVANGGGSTLYGNYGLGGVVQLLKRIPTPATLKFQGQGGSRNSLKGDFYASHRLGPWGVSLAGSFFDFDGYPIVVESQRGTVDIAAFSRHQAVRLSVERAPTQGSLVWSLEGGFLNEHRGNGTPMQTNRTFTHDLSMGIQWSPRSQDRLEIRTFFRRNTFASNFSAVAEDRHSERLTTQQGVPSADGGASLLWYASRGRHRIVTGTDFWLVSGQSADNVFFGPRVGLVRLGGGKQATIGFFGEENYALSSRATVVLGARLDVWKNFDGIQGSFPPGFRKTDPVGSRTEVVFSPRAGFTYQVNSWFSLHGSAFRSFRAPTLNELYRAFRVGNVVTNPNSDLVPERNTGAELGVRFQLAENLRLGIAGFVNVLNRPVSNVTQEITSDLITRQRRNLGRVRISGFQANARWQPVPQLELEADYLFNRSPVTRFDSPEVIGNQLPQVPENRFTVKTDLALPQAIHVAVIGRFVGEQFDDDLNRIVLGRYFQLDSQISRPLGEAAKLFLALENITDAEILVNRSPVDFLGAPFQVRGGLLIQFDRGK